MISVDVIWAALIGYALGSFPTSYILGKVLLGLDIRTIGSHNVGGRNLIRAMKMKEKPSGVAYGWGLVVAILDIFKGYFAMWLSQFLSFNYANSDPWVICFAAAGAVLGHNWPIWLMSHGGRGVATSLGIIVFFNPLGSIAWLIGFVIIGSIVMYSAITYILDFILIGVILYFLPTEWFWTPIHTDLTTFSPSIQLIAMVTLFAITCVILTRQYENFKKIKTGEAKRMKIWKVFIGQFSEALK
ncbi:MAG: glycerol-3-phosphate acyltransferase [Candidatus Heimdallarchaeaceae archaeon]